ncbi:hypothetical protein D9Q98_009217 [Chlorella vulgaris]|uniref:DUF1995 domain-containing protein n=1 Tax=Chlorella vulgaris TaxID=3077 RepID=A0A9D4TPD0_CHLVU|nr:hypothetical protein D9Q98_009217 [Chlorella vulgaris]
MAARTATSSGPTASCRRRTSLRCLCGAAPPIAPRSCSEAASQARSALRRFREAAGDGGNIQDQQRRQQQGVSICLPLPSPEYLDEAVRPYSQSDWPGGIVQRFRRLRPLVEDHLLSGYNAEFVGMLESPADGIGVWRAASASMTVVTQVSNLTFSIFARLCDGEFGKSVLEPGHLLVAVNPTWTQSRDIGQLWDRKLRARAAAIIDGQDAWLPLYHLDDERTAKGATGFLFRCWPHDWQLHSTCGQDEEEPAQLQDPPILVSQQRPSQERVVEALNAALAVHQQEEREQQRQSK